jgi:hypothetical protein
MRKGVAIISNKLNVILHQPLFGVCEIKHATIVVVSQSEMNGYDFTGQLTNYLCCQKVSFLVPAIIVSLSWMHALAEVGGAINSTYTFFEPAD